MPDLGLGNRNARHRESAQLKCIPQILLFEVVYGHKVLVTLYRHGAEADIRVIVGISSGVIGGGLDLRRRENCDCCLRLADKVFRARVINILEYYTIIAQISCGNSYILHSHFVAIHHNTASLPIDFSGITLFEIRLYAMILFSICIHHKWIVSLEKYFL